MYINLEYYRAFYYVAVYKSISRAAEELYISQPALSKSIQNLEKKLHCTLFTRSSQGTTLTQDGMILFNHVSHALQEFEAGEQKVSRVDSKLIQDIYIGATESSLYSIVLPLLVDFKKDYPHVRFHISGCSTGELMGMLSEGTIDLALGVTPLPDGIDHPVTELSEVQDVFFIHEDYPIDDSVPLSLEQLSHCPLVGVGPESSAGKHIACFFRENGFVYEPMFTVETSSQVSPFVRSKLGIGIAPRWTLRLTPPYHDLRELKTSFSISPRHIFLAVNHKYPMSPICQMFVRLIQEKTAY